MSGAIILWFHAHQGSIQEAPLFRYPAARAVFWLGHFLGFYALASTIIASIGEKVLRRIQGMLLRRGPLLLIYGINSHSVAYGRRMAKEKRRSVVFVDQEYNSSFDGAVKAFGGVIEKSPDALAASVRFLRQLNMKPGNRKLELAVLHTDSRANLSYAQTLLASLTERGIHPGQTRLLAAGLKEEAAALQHACLIPWEELDDLSRRENAVTGGQTDYKQMDRNNILIFSRVLKK